MIKKILILILYGVMLIMPIQDTRVYQDIQTSFSDSCQIKLMRNNTRYIFDKDTPMYNSILFEFENMLIGANQMPALGVSIDELTREKMEIGIWLEFEFDSISYNSEMPFESLLVEINKDYYGFNVIRKYNNKYDGRCYYINLNDRSMNHLYEYLINIKL